MTFHAILPGWLIIVILSLLTLLFLALEWRRKHRFLAARLIAVMIMMVMLAGMLLRPARRVEHLASTLLLTPGYSTKKVDSLLNTDAGIDLKHVPGTVPYKGSRLLPSYQDLASAGSSLTFIVGNGIPGYALDLIPEKNFHFIPSEIPEGVIALNIPEAVANHPSSIDGVFNNSGGIKWIYLNGPGGKVDSAQITVKDKTFFNLQFTPVQFGSVLYNLSIKDSSETKSVGDIPVAVQNEKPLNILFLQGYPTFETQYLKNFLAHKKHALVLRSQLSKNNFRYEYANHGSTSISRLTKNILNEFDLLITDQESLNQLSGSEKTILNEAVTSGMGFLEVSSKEFKPRSHSSVLFPFELRAVKSDTTIIRPASKLYTLPAIPVRAVNSAHVQPVTTNTSGILSGYTFTGAGKTGFQFLQETYRLTLSGDSAGYSAIWSPLIGHLARIKDQSSSLRIASPFPLYSDEPIALDVISSEQKPVLQVDSIPVSLQEDVILDDIWHTTVWGDHVGWHSLKVNDDDVSSLYISKDDEWRSLAIANQQMQSLNAMTSKKSASIKTTEEREMSQRWFFVLFILAAGFIWLAPKL